MMHISVQPVIDPLLTHGATFRQDLSKLLVQSQLTDILLLIIILTIFARPSMPSSEIGAACCS